MRALKAVRISAKCLPNANHSRPLLAPRLGPNGSEAKPRAASERSRGTDPGGASGGGIAMRIEEDGTGRAPRGVVENKARQQLARALMCNGPLTARGLASDAERSTAWARYHLRVLCTSGAAAPLLLGMAEGDEIAYRLTPEDLSEREEEILLGELSLQICGRLMAHLLMDGPLTPVELAERTGLHWREVSRYLKALRAHGCSEDAPRAEPGGQADRLRGYPEWFVRWVRATTDGDHDGTDNEIEP